MAAQLTERPESAPANSAVPQRSTTSAAPTTSAAAPSSTTTTRPAPTTTRTIERSTARTTTAPRPTTTTPRPTSVLDAPPQARSAVEAVTALVNEARADNGCGPVRVDERIAEAAQQHSTDMALRDYFSHDSLEGLSFSDRILDAGYPSPAGENIAKGQRTAEQVMNDWMNSPGHRANILNCDFDTIGVGLDKNGWLWTQDFGY